MGLASSDSVEMRESGLVPGCVEAHLNTHPCSPLFLRDDDDGTGHDIRLLGEQEVISAPQCNCTRDGIRSGSRLVELVDGSKAWYTEPAPRCFHKKSASINFGGALTPTTANSSDLVTGPVILEVKTGCYPQKIQPTLQVCEYTNALPAAGTGDYRERFWRGDVGWETSINNQPYNTETGQTTEEHEENYCTVAGHGGHLNFSPSPFTLPAESVARIALRIYARNIGPLSVDSYPVTIRDAHVSAICHEVTSMASTINPSEEVC